MLIKILILTVMSVVFKYRSDTEGLYSYEREKDLISQGNLLFLE